MGQLMVRKRSSMSVAKKVGIGLLVCFVALKVLPMVIGAGIIVGVIGLALTTMIIGALTWLLSIGLYVGVPVFVIALLLGLFSRDD